MKLLIGFFDAGLPFSGSMDIAKSPLGGSETAAYYMARHLAARGHEVKFINHCPEPGKYHGVAWFDHSVFPTVAAAADFDVFICNRAILQLTSNFKSRWNVIWCHDMPPESTESFSSCLWAIDQLFVMSKFQANAYHNISAVFPRDAWDRVLTITRNGIDLDLIRKSTKHVKKHPKRLFYMSRPERGLAVLVKKIWPVLKQRDPDLELCICSYDLGQIAQGLPEHMKEFYAYMDKLLEVTPGIHNLGNLGKSDLYEALASSALLVYPTDFPEISCISGAEAMACGTPVVSTNNFALPETLGDAAVLIDGKTSEPEYRDKFCEAVLNLLEDDEKYSVLQTRGLERAQQLDWAGVAEQWESIFFQRFAQRCTRFRAGICRQLIYMSDLVQANRMAHEYPEECKEELELTDKLLEVSEGEPERYSLSTDLQDALDTWETNSRFGYITERIPEDAVTLLDVGCNVGTLFAQVAKLRPNIKQMVGIDSSEDLISKAHEFVAKTIDSPGLVTLVCKRIQDFEGQFDVVVCAELLEHVKDTQGLVAQLERLCKPGGRIILTVPVGPWEAESFHELQKARIREHVHHFDFEDLRCLFGAKKKYNIDMSHTLVGARGDLLGNWLVFYTNDPKKPTGEVNYERKALTTRPYQRISACMIVKDEEEWILRCVKSMLDVMDEIIIYDTGSTDHTEEVVSWVSNRYRPQIRYIKGYWDTEDGFAGARNRSMETAIGEWIFWIDADEVLVGDRQMIKYVNRGEVFPGYIVRQNHMLLDIKAEPDNPVRLFRSDVGAQFFGCIHEHAELKLNKPIEPVLILPDVQVAHYGYLTESIRREKCAKRNMPLLIKDREKNPNRLLGLIFLQRDYIHIAQWQIQNNRGAATEEAIKYLKEVIRVYDFLFKKLETAPRKSQYWRYSFAFYQEALKMMGDLGIPLNDADDLPFEVALGLAGGYCGLNTSGDNIPIGRRWFTDKEELHDWLSREGSKLDDALAPRRLF